ncbi:potassium channel family protein [uncultured Flavobacterium sp.]|uniref:potassium channel family protein n=1 Tax=uncultured Flavobacterium sp. TaxID=165435 RepID=UPI0025E98C31|nr:potassium channel family protein [uncultured Flavobacterium sp.]
MTKSSNQHSGSQLGILNILVIVLSIYVLGALIIDSIIELPSETSILLRYIDNSICVFFFIEFCIRFYKAKDKLKFMYWGWVDLISCIPMVGYLRAGRLLRLIKLLRILRAFRSVTHLVNHLFINKARGTLVSISTFAVLLVIFSAIAILQVETSPNSNICTAEDAIWWAYVTITTVGYGDLFPVTTEGRIIATVLMTTGVGLFGTFTAYVASWFVEDKKS